MRRLAVLPVAAAITAAALAGCGSSSKTTSNPTTGGSSPTTAASTGGTGGTGGSGGSGAAIKTQNPSKPVTLTESGSSLLFPYLGELTAPLKAAFPNVTLTPAAGGSGKGISDATSGTADLGGTDAYLSPSQAATPGLANIPIVVSAQAVDYNLKGVTGLKLSGDLLAQIYQGTITMWNDPAIKKLNPTANLPATKITPIHRSDSSGDTFLFTSFLSATNSQWSSKVSIGTTVTWPSASNLTASGNPGMVQTCAQTNGCIAYVGVSAQSSATTAGLEEASLQNKAGQFTTPSEASINAAVNSGLSQVKPNLVANLIYGAGASSYPIVNFEYLVVKDSQSDPDKAAALRDFFSVALDTTKGATEANLQKEGFVALPTSVVSKVNDAVNKIGG